MKNISYLKTLTLSVCIFFLHFNAFSQSFERGSLNYLLTSNGFDKIKLGTDFTRLQNANIGYLDNIDSLDTDSCYKFCYRDTTLLNLGEGLQLNLIGFRTYKNKIANVYLFFSRDYGYAVLKDFEASYGKFTKSPGDFMYDWDTNGVKLSLRYKQGVDMGVAIFTCKNIEKEILADDNQRKAMKASSKNLLGSL